MAQPDTDQTKAWGEFLPGLVSILGAWDVQLDRDNVTTCLDRIRVALQRAYDWGWDNGRADAEETARGGQERTDSAYRAALAATGLESTSGTDADAAIVGGLLRKLVDNAHIGRDGPSAYLDLDEWGRSIPLTDREADLLIRLRDQ